MQALCNLQRNFSTAVWRYNLSLLFFYLVKFVVDWFVVFLRRGSSSATHERHTHSGKGKAHKLHATRSSWRLSELFSWLSMRACCCCCFCHCLCIASFLCLRSQLWLRRNEKLSTSSIYTRSCWAGSKDYATAAKRLLERPKLRPPQRLLRTTFVTHLNNLYNYVVYYQTRE